MKNILLAKCLAPIGRKIAKRFDGNGPVVAITGSAGKTSTKEAIGLMAQVVFNNHAMVSAGNLNNDIGLPLSLVGFKKSPNPLLYPLVIIQGWWKATMMLLPSAYVLEYGVDGPGDMTHLASIIKPTIIVYTNIGNVHLENFQSHQELIDEKMLLAKYISKDGLIVYNGDDKILTENISKLPHANTLSFGYGKDNDLSLSRIDIRSNSTAFTASFKGQRLELEIKALGRQHVLAVAPAVALGFFWKAGKESIAKAIANYEPQPGRGNIIFGQKDTVIINDTYNASPIATLAALDVLAAMPGKPKMTVLGDMLELGPESEAEHRKILTRAGEVADIIITVGKRMGILNMSHFRFCNPDAAIEKVKEKLTPGMVVLIKGSQGMRMEIVAKAIMLETSKANKLLPRQTESWLKKPFKEV